MKPSTDLAAKANSDWRTQLRCALRTPAALGAYLELTQDERHGLRVMAERGLPLSITPHYLSLCDPSDPRCPIRQQCVPVAAEQVRVDGDLSDPLGEEAHEVAPNLVQRYPDRVLLLVTDLCGVYCRFCTRSRLVGGGAGAQPDAALEPALTWIAQHPEVREVIVSGGDPLMLSDERLERLLKRLAAIASVEVVRMATRMPVTLPQRITPELVAALRAFPSLWLMTHFNHIKELGDAAQHACARLVDHGIPVMNHTVLLRGINDRPETLEQLFRGLIRSRVRPYYLLQADVVGGTAHLRTPLSTGLDVMRTLQGRLSGIALPRFIVDTPGGHGKVPLLPSYLQSYANGRALLRTFRGCDVVYPDPP